MKMKNLIGVAMLVSVLSAPCFAEAAPITVDFSFSNAGATVATGSFTYDSSITGDITSYNELSAFSVTPVSGGTTSTLADALAATNYVYFNFDPATSSFVPGLVNGSVGSYGDLLSASVPALDSGFYFDPLPSMSASNNDGEFVFYPNAVQAADGFSASVVPVPVPAPGGAGLLAVGLGALVWVRRRDGRGLRRFERQTAD